MRNEKEAMAFTRGRLSGLEMARDAVREVRQESYRLNQIDLTSFDTLEEVDRRLQAKIAEAEL